MKTLPKLLLAVTLVLCTSFVSDAITSRSHDRFSAYKVAKKNGCTDARYDRVGDCEFYIISKSIKNKSSKYPKVYGLTDENGKLLLPVTYQIIYRRAPNDDYILVNSKGKYGLYDVRKAEFYVPCEFAYAQNLAPGIVKVYLDKNQKKPALYSVDAGRVILKGDIKVLDYHTVEVNTKGKKGIFDIKSKTYVVPVKYDNISIMENDYEVTLKDKHGIYNKQGELVVPVKYHSILPNADGEYTGQLKNGGKYMPLGVMQSRYQSGIADNLRKRYGHIEKKGWYYIVGQANEQGLYDMDGKEILPNLYGSIRITDGYCTAKRNGYALLVDLKTRKILIGPDRKYTEIYTREKYDSKRYLIVRGGENGKYYGVCRWSDFTELAPPQYRSLYIDISDDFVALEGEKEDDFINYDLRLKILNSYRKYNTFWIIDSNLIRWETDNGATLFSVREWRNVKEDLPKGRNIYYDGERDQYYHYEQNGREYLGINGLGMQAKSREIDPYEDLPFDVRYKIAPAKKGDTRYQRELGLIFFYGKDGVSRNYAEAVKWFKMAAAAGNTDAMCDLGYCYYNGYGVNKNYSDAFFWFKKSAEQDNENGMYNTGLCYEFGHGTAKNLVEAEKYYKLAAVYRHADAAKRLEIVRRQLYQQNSAPVYNAPASNQYQNQQYQQIQNQQNQQAEHQRLFQHYYSIYKGYEKEAMSHWNSLRVAGDSSYGSILGNYRVAQSRMQNTRMEAAGKGVQIPVSSWETLAPPLREYK